MVADRKFTDFVTSKGEFILMDLPFKQESKWDDLIKYHYGKHHHGYVKKLNSLLKESDFNKDTYEIASDNFTNNKTVFNNAAQVWNHDFFWNSINLSANFNSSPSEDLLLSINKNFGDLQKFSDLLIQKSMAHFGSGWVWLIYNSDSHQLSITTTSNAEIPSIINKNHIPLINIDLWEHAYYIDYKNDRKQYTEDMIKVIDWDFASDNFRSLMKQS